MFVFHYKYIVYHTNIFSIIKVFFLYNFLITEVIKVIKLFHYICCILTYIHIFNITQTWNSKNF